MSSQLPTELWLAIFDSILADYHDRNHIFDQSVTERLEVVQNLQNLQFVCRSWRTIIRPLTFRHPAFPFTRGKEPTLFLRFANLFLSPTTSPDPVRPEWIRTLYIHDPDYEYAHYAGFFSIPASFLEPWRALIPLLTSLRETCLRVVLPHAALVPIVRHHGTTIRTMGLCLAPDSLQKFLSRVSPDSSLNTLRIECKRWKTHDSHPRGRPITLSLSLPHLRTLEIATGHHHHNTLAFLANAHLPRLERLRAFDLPIETLGLSAMLRRGTHLSLLGLELRHSVNTAVHVFPYTPLLTTLRISGSHHLAWHLRGLPACVSTVQLSDTSPTHSVLTQYTHLLCDVAIAVQGVLAHRAPPVFQLVYTTLYARGKKRTWEQLFERPRRDVVGWREFGAAAREVLRTGVRVVDEDGVAVEDVVGRVEGLEWRGDAKT